MTTDPVSASSAADAAPSGAAAPTVGASDSASAAPPASASVSAPAATSGTHSIGAQIAAWSVHALTLSGLLWATLAVFALVDGHIAMMWLWLGIALVVDGLDGTLARHARVKEVVPWLDGSALDIVIDYLTWTFIPAMFIVAHLPSGPRLVGAALMALILISSMFCYANERWKSTDHYFVGFPAAWNVVALILYLLGTGAAFNGVVIVLLAIATLIPTHYTHPFRVKHLMVPNILAAVAWIGSSAWLVVTHPEQPLVAVIIFWVSGGWFMLSGALRTIHGRIARKSATEAPEL